MSARQARERTPELSSRFEFANVQALRLALDHHNRTCPVRARAFLLNPIDFGLLGFDELLGVPVLSDQKVSVKAFRIDCEGCAWEAEDELERLLAPDTI
jgi:hypothetical protein